MIGQFLPHFIRELQEADLNFTQTRGRGNIFLSPPEGKMSFTYDTSNNVGKVRAIINDITESSALLTDEQINVYLDMTGNDLLSAASQAAYAIAANKALLAKKKSAGGYSEDLTAIGKMYLELAKHLKEQAMSIPAEAVAEQFWTDFSYREVLTAKELREESE